MTSRKDLRSKFEKLQDDWPTDSPGGCWQTLEELADTDAFQQLMRQEFPALADVWPDALNRRKFLGLMAASLALAGLGSCSVKPAPEGTIVPYVDPPEQAIPGVPLFFATTAIHNGNAVGLLVESHEGRPTKIEGNPDHPASLGAASIFDQAAALTLYDPARSQTVIRNNEIRSWDEVADAIEAALKRQRGQRGRGLRILTETVVSPTLGRQLDELLEEYPEARWHQYEPVHCVGAFQAAQRGFGEAVEPIYDFEQADVVVSLDCDFLTSGPGNLKYARDFINRRRVHTPDADAAMNRLYVAEAAVTPTGARADSRLAVSLEGVSGIASNLAARLGIEGLSASESPHDRWLTAVARDLLAHRGRSVILAGPRQPESVHLLAHAMNQQMENVGQTVHYTPSAAVQPVNALDSLRDLVEALDRGEVQELFILGGNPALTAPVDFNFAERLQQVPQSFHLSLYEDETSRRCTWHLPETHFLEMWSDARAFDGTCSLVQPLIAPLYEGRSMHEVIAMLQGRRQVDGREIVQSTWRRRWAKQNADETSERSFDAFWNRSLHDGFIAETAFAKRTLTMADNWQDGVATTSTPAQEQGTFQLVFQPDPTLYDGRYANNGWLQELPKPITKLTWGNALLLSPRTAQALGLRYASFAHAGEHGGYDVPVVRLEVGDRHLEVPVWIMPGHADEAVTLWLGSGRDAASRASGVWQETLGVNAYQIRTADRPWSVQGARMVPLDKTFPLACTQAHHLMEDRDVIRRTTLDEFLHRSEQAVEQNEEQEQESLSRVRPPTSLYESFDYEPPLHKWGMSIDLTSCIGCNACIVACQSENNIPVVGKEQVLMGREMHWLRVDRYVQGDLADPEEFHFQPLPCMHCEHAPCEYVCPVEATVHSAEGLNDMVYNRCVGTRFCSNNCPYKVRRFNFLAYADFETVPLRLQYNPDVTVRSRGVMEKCTYCVQRIRQAEISAEAAGRPMIDGEVLTACQATCPTQAIVFGDLNDAGSAVSECKQSPLNYDLLAELNTVPRTSYLAAVRNPNPELEEAANE